MKLEEKPTLPAAWHHHRVITSRFSVNIELPCKILDFQMTAPRASLCCCDSDWHTMRRMGQGKHFDARCWTAALEISGVYEVTSANGIDSATKIIMRSNARAKDHADLPLPVTSMTCRRVLILTHQGTGHYPPSTEKWSNDIEARMWPGLFLVLGECQMWFVVWRHGPRVWAVWIGWLFAVFSRRHG